MYGAEYQKEVTVSVAADPGAGGGWSDPIEPLVPDGHGKVLLVITLAGSAVTVQVSTDKANWYTFNQYTTVGGYVIDLPISGVWLRAGVAAADWSAAAAALLRR